MRIRIFALSRRRDSVVRQMHIAPGIRQWLNPIGGFPRNPSS